MNDGRITYSHAAIDMLVTEVNTSSKRLGDTLDDLTDYLKPITNGWEGDAAAAYKMHQTDWNNAAAALKSMLADIARVALQSNQGMADADRAAARGWG